MSLFARRRKRAMPPPQDQPDTWGYELLLYANEQILRGSDNGTLVAFAALAFQQIRGKGEFHHDVGCGFLMFSVLMCAVVHFAMGYVYLGRALDVISRESPGAGVRALRRFYVVTAIASTVIQFAAVIVGTLLILPEAPPAWLERRVLVYFH